MNDMSNFSMLELFRMEVDSQAEILNHNLLSLENNPTGATELEALMRSSHSIKGAARIVQLEAAVRVAHVMEDCFVAAQTGAIALSPDHIDILLQGADTLIQIAHLDETELESWQTSHQTELEALIAAIAQIHNPPAAPKPATVAIIAPETPLEAVIEPAVVPPPETPPEASIIVSPPQSVTTTPPPPKDTQPLTSKPQTTSDRVIRVSAENLNRLMGLAGESLVEANWLQPFADSLLELKNRQADLSRLLEQLNTSLADKNLDPLTFSQLKGARQKADECRQILFDRLNRLELFARRSANLSDRLYREVIATHMRPFADGVQGFPRMIRDLAKRLGKQVRLEIIGKSTPVDRDILEKLEAPLTHILRNAVDHGLETPEERLTDHKPAEGTIRLEAAHRAGMLSITVSDDGRGVNHERLRQKVLNLGLVNADMAAQLSETELIDFLFLPGFSTAGKVTEISGRGVGLDVVQSMVQEVGGTLRAFSQPGKGMTFHLQLPLTLSVIRTLLVEIAREPYAFPLSRINRIATIPYSEITTAENRQYFTLDGQNIGLVTARQVLELHDDSPQFLLPFHDEPRTVISQPQVFSSLDELPVVIIGTGQNCYGLAVDRFLGERDLVVRPLDPRLGKVPDISAVALMEDGSPVLIVDVEDLQTSIQKLLSTGWLTKVNQQQSQQLTYRKRKRILVVDDSITVRETERNLLERNGYEVEVAVNGMDGWNAVRMGHFDLVITDVDMPRMDGIKLVTQIKNLTSLQHLPVIIVSYKDREEDRMRGLEANADYYLTKSSFHDGTLLNAVRDLIGQAEDESLHR